MPCTECERIREQHPGALCGECAKAVDTLYSEVERLKAANATLSELTGVEEKLRRRAEQAEARLREAMEIVTPKYTPLREVGDDDACSECGEWFTRRGDGSLCDSCAQELLSLVKAALAAAQPKEVAP